MNKADSMKALTKKEHKELHELSLASANYIHKKYMKCGSMQEKLEAEAREDRKREEIESRRVNHDWPHDIPTDISRDGECE